MYLIKIGRQYYSNNLTNYCTNHIANATRVKDLDTALAIRQLLIDSGLSNVVITDSFNPYKYKESKSKKPIDVWPDDDEEM